MNALIEVEGYRKTFDDAKRDDKGGCCKLMVPVVNSIYLSNMRRRITKTSESSVAIKQLSERVCFYNRISLGLFLLSVLALSIFRVYYPHMSPKEAGILGLMTFTFVSNAIYLESKGNSEFFDDLIRF